MQRPDNNSRLYDLVAGVFLGLTVLSVVYTILLASNPSSRLNPFPGQANLTPVALLGPTDTPTPDPRLTLPPTWTPSNSPSPPDTSTPTRTPTITPTLTPTTTRAPTMTFTPVATLPPGWAEVVVSDARFAIGLTSTWVAFTMSDRDPASTLAQIGQEDPTLGASLEVGLGDVILDNVSLIAFDAATATDAFVVNLNVSTASGSDGDDIDAILENRTRLYEESAFYELLATDNTHVDFHPARRIRYTSQFQGAEESMTVYHLEVIVDAPRDAILLFVFSTSEERRNVYEALVDRIVTTIRFTR
jgi:hypothetical protein